MTMYATPSDLASFLQQDLDTATATLVLTKVSGLFDSRARTHWGGTASTTFAKPGYGKRELVMPYHPLVAVSAVRVAGVTLSTSDYAVIEQSVFRRIGFGVPWRYPPDLVEVDYTYGYPGTVPDDVASAVLESAALAYSNPSGAMREQIDDYTVQYQSGPEGGLRLTNAARELADAYAGPLIA